MKSFSSKRGSALLIVLGMLAFMVVSAVAFSAYMRTSRLPSSYLRRTVASRLLAKAALAEAMERLDIAIADNPYPGVGNQVLANDYRYKAANIKNDNQNHNYFYRNIFIGTNGWLDAENTVSVLNLEALAYVPMSLVNEARLYSRMSPTATWHPLRFDAGRYAYTAIDVSDFFDVNRLSANLKRDSGANRISLAYLFENDDHTGYGTPSPADWDQFVDRCFNNSDMPFVSLADLNLAMGDTANGSKIQSPFCRYLQSGTAQTFYQNPTEAKRYQQFNFVTDSYFPPVDIGEARDLADEDGQPFSEIFADGALNNAKAQSNGGPFEDLSVFTLGALWDYLDEDSVPISLAVPTVEQNPMIARIEPRKLFTVRTETEEDKDTSVPNKETVHTKYKISAAFLTQLRDVKVDLVYPFKYVESPDAYEVDVSASIFLCTWPNPKFVIERFYPGDDVNNLFKAGIDKDGDIPYVFRVVGSKSLTILSTAKLTDPKEAVHSLSISLNDMDNIQNFFNETPIFETKVTYDVDPETKTRIESSGKVIEAKFNVLPVNDTGGLDTSKYSNDGDATAIAARIALESSAPVYPCVAIAVRVKNKASDVDAYVDLAPAGWGGDELNGVTGNLGGGAGLFLPPRCPVLPFVGKDAAFEFNAKFFEANKSGNTTTLEPEAIICPDPRYNHSTGDWLACASGDEWLDKCGVGEASDQDHDIFMAVSDQGYLQSLYELAFIPRLDNTLPDPDGEKFYEYKKPDDDSQSTYLSAGLNRDLYWCTYKCYNKGTKDDLTNAFQVVSAATSYKINPYSQNLNSIMAAFANTPRNWRAASTSDMADGATLAAKDFNKKYTLSALEWEDLEELAANFQEEAQKAAQQGESWEDAWDDLGWEETGNFLGLHDVDRKFLYGYWRDSFANRQQLFLVFVRAEPTMMDGGAVGATPPQLGARAVALVWRNPEVAQPNQPHRMRILFYRQFE